MSGGAFPGPGPAGHLPQPGQQGLRIGEGEPTGQAGFINVQGRLYAPLQGLNPNDVLNGLLEVSPRPAVKDVPDRSLPHIEGVGDGVLRPPLRCVAPDSPNVLLGQPRGMVGLPPSNPPRILLRPDAATGSHVPVVVRDGAFIEMRGIATPSIVTAMQRIRWPVPKGQQERHAVRLASRLTIPPHLPIAIGAPTRHPGPAVVRAADIDLRPEAVEMSSVGVHGESVPADR